MIHILNLPSSQTLLIPGSHTLLTSLDDGISQGDVPTWAIEALTYAGLDVKT